MSTPFVSRFGSITLYSTDDCWDFACLAEAAEWLAARGYYRNRMSAHCTLTNVLRGNGKRAHGFEVVCCYPDGNGPNELLDRQRVLFKHNDVWKDYAGTVYQVMLHDNEIVGFNGDSKYFIPLDSWREDWPNIIWVRMANER